MSMKMPTSYLITKGYGHDRNKEAEEELQLSQAIIVDKEERESIRDGDQNSSPERYFTHTE